MKKEERCQISRYCLLHFNLSPLCPRVKKGVGRVVQNRPRQVKPLVFFTDGGWGIFVTSSDYDSVESSFAGDVCGIIFPFSFLSHPVLNGVFLDWALFLLRRFNTLKNLIQLVRQKRTRKKKRKLY